MSPFWYLTAALSTCLQVLVLATAVRRGLVSRYPFLFLYCLAVFASGIIEWAALLGIATLFPTGRETFAVYYWSNEAAILALLLALMVALIYRGLEGVQGRWTIVAGLVLVVLLVSAGTTYFQQDEFAAGDRLSYAKAMTLVSRNLAFCTALLNMVLWTVMVRQKVRDSQLLLVSAGLGLVSTGKAIGHSLRGINQSFQTSGDIIVVFTDLLCLAIWLFAFHKFRSPAQKRREPAPV